MNDKNIEELDFGHIYFGQKRIIQITLLNRSPLKRTFIIRKFIDPNSSQQKYNFSDFLFYSVPNEGIIPPNKEMSISFVFCPPKQQQNIQIQDDENAEILFNQVSIIEVIETKETIDLELNGIGVFPKCKLSSADFTFGYQKVNTKSTKTLTIYNKSIYLPLTFKISKTLMFKFNPSHGIIPINGEKTITITFLPENSGDFESNIYISFSDVIVKKYINVSGIGIFNNDSPKKFIRENIWEIDSSAKYSAEHPYDNRYGLSINELQHKSKLRKMFDQYITDSAENRKEILTKKEIKTNVIKTIKLKSQENGIHFDKDDIKQMINQEMKEKLNPEYNEISQNETLIPSDPKIPNFNNSLFIQNPQKLGLITLKNNKTQNIKIFNEPLKLKNKPTTLPEINDCVKQLTPVQLLQIITSCQTLNFGLVSVLSKETKEFVIQNKLNQYVFVEFDFDEFLEIKNSYPKSQVIPPMQVAIFNIIFSTENPKNFNEKIKYKINKTIQYLNISVKVIPIEINISKTLIEFKFNDESFQSYIQEPIVIQNKSNSIAYFNWEKFDLNEFKIDCSNGFVSPQSSKTFIITYSPLNLTHSEETVTLNIKGGSKYNIKLIGNIDKPLIKLNKKTLNFGLFSIGINKSMKIIMKNKGKSFGFFNIINYTQLKNENILITPINGRINSGDSRNLIITVLRNKPGKFNKTIQINLSGTNPIEFNIFGETEIISNENENINKNIINDNKTNEIKSKQIIHSPLKLSTNSIYFGTTPIFKDSNPYVRPIIKELILTNESTNDIEFKFELNSSDFSIDKTEGIIKYGMELKNFILFKPRNVQTYKCNLILHIKTYDKKEIKNEIQLCGVGTSKLFKTSVDYLFFPIMPLGVTLSKTIYIFNTSFSNTKIYAQIPVLENVFPIKVLFPNGQEMKNIEKLPITITFQSNKPISFSTVIAILDDFGNSYKFIVSITTDNSIFTLYPFISLNKYSIHNTNNSIIAKFDHQNFDNLEFLAKFISENDLLEIQDLKGQTSKETADFLKRFLNNQVLSYPIESFPEDIVNSNGKILIDMINNLTIEQQKIQKSEDPFILHLNILHTLTELGLKVAEIRPEFLLDKIQFMKYHEQKIISKMLGIEFNYPNIEEIDDVNDIKSSYCFKTVLYQQLEIVEQLYEIVSLESYTFLMLQLFKVFFLPKVLTNKMNSLPGIQNALKTIKENVNDQIYNNIIKNYTSNIYNSSELTLLKWINIHYNHINYENPKIFMDFKELNSLEIIKSIVQSHIPNKEIKDIISTINEIDLHIPINENDIINGNQIILIIIYFQLYQVLPQLIPSMIINFDSFLNEKTTQSLQIANPSKKEIIYHANIIGSNNFKYINEYIKLEPNQKLEFQIEYKPNFLISEKAILILKPEKPKNVNSQQSKRPIFASIIVVKLISNVSVKSSSKTFEIQTFLYEPIKTTLNIDNIFNINDKFEIFSNAIKINDINGKKVLPILTINDQINEILNDQNEIKNEFITFDDYIKNHQTFIIRSKEIEIPIKSSIDIEFNPISVGTFRCVILFRSENNEFIYEIIGKSNLPKPITIKTSIKVEAQQRLNVNIPIDIINQKLIHSLSYSYQKSKNITFFISDRKLNNLINLTEQDLKSIYLKSFNSLKFNSEISSQHFIFPKEIEIFKNKENSFLLTFKPLKPGEYPIKIILTSEFDIRIYSLIGIAIPITKKFDILFETISGKTVEQKIPIKNPSNNIWRYKTNINGDHEFYVPQTFVIEPLNEYNLILRFKTYKIGKHEADLIITNTTKEATIKYHLLANVSEPEAIDKIVIHCKAHEKYIHKINVPSFVYNKTVDVKSTIPIIECSKTLTFDNNKYKQFPFVIFSLRSGISIGTLTFIDPETKIYCWYIIECYIEEPTAQETIEINAIARKTITIQIPLKNTSSKNVNFGVTFSDDDLFGEKKILIPANSSFVYNLIFSPLIEQRNRISTISFYNDIIGEYIYNLNINVNKSEPEILNKISCPIGKITSIFITLENIFTKTIKFIVENDNSINFQVIISQTFELKENEIKQIEIRYNPTTIGKNEIANIKFKSDELGEYLYKVIGIGKPPPIQLPLTIETNINKTSIGIIEFINPFYFPAQFSITLNNEKANQNVFNLLSRKKFSLTNYGDTNEIQISFLPPFNGEFKSNIIVTYNDIQWVYPIIGICNSLNTKNQKIIYGMSYQKIQKEISLFLIGEKENYKISEYKIIVQYQKGFEFVSKYLNIFPINIIKNENNNKYINLQIKYYPKRPMNTFLIIIIKNPLEQSWKFNVKLQIESSEPLQNIILECSLDKIIKYKPKIVDEFDEKTPFHAYLVNGSSSEFSISSSKGFIEPFVDEMPFDVLFSPKIYGKVMKAQLIIDTLEVQFKYDLIGRIPKYMPPKVCGGRIDLSTPESLKRNNAVKRNIVKENIENAKISIPKLLDHQEKIFLCINICFYYKFECLFSVLR